uniref:Putative ferredoxin n=1 Tax=Aedes albopictus TaxID=7160 RepID=A0A023EPA4_AEDAL
MFKLITSRTTQQIIRKSLAKTSLVDAVGTCCSNNASRSVISFQQMRLMQSVSRNLSTSQPKLQNEEVEVTFVRANGERIKAKGKVGDSLLDVIVNNQIDLEGFGACEGTLTCSTCHLIFSQADYDAQSGCIGQLVGQIQHVQLFIARFLRQGIVVGLREDQMASRTGQRALARSESLQIDLIVDDHIEQRVAHLSFRLYPFSVGSHKCDLNLFVLQLRLGCGQISGHALHQPHLLERDDTAAGIVATAGANSVHQTGFGQALPNYLLSGT